MNDFGLPLIPLFGIAAFFGTPVLLVLISSYYGNKNKDKFNETVQQLISSGQEITPDLLKSFPGHGSNIQKEDIRTGVITSGVGVGIICFGKFGVSQTPLIGIGLLVLAIGISFVIYGCYAKYKFENNN